jgi:DNA-binding LacI/PurR family transcriptional regulator
MSVTRIAEKAGVSIATVSRVLNNSRPVNPKIAEMVRRAMEELQLPPRSIRRRSRARAGDRNATIAIVSVGQEYSDWFEVPVIASVVAELTRAAQELHMGVLMAEMPDPTQISPTLRRPEVDGAVCFISSGLSTKDSAALRGQLPVVRVMGGQLAPVEIDHIGPDNNAIGWVAGRYLLDHGLREMAFFSTRPTWDFTKLRAQGFMAAAQSSGVMPAVYLLEDGPVPLGFFGPRVVCERELLKVMSRLKEQTRGKLGLFVARDEEAVLAYRLLREVGMEPGRDVVVVSCDNETVRLSTLHPRPASVDLGAPEIAKYAVRRLAQRIKHKDEPPVRVLVSPRLVQGEPVEGQPTTTE